LRRPCVGGWTLEEFPRHITAAPESAERKVLEVRDAEGTVGDPCLCLGNNGLEPRFEIVYLSSHRTGGVHVEMDISLLDSRGESEYIGLLRPLVGKNEVELENVFDPLRGVAEIGADRLLGKIGVTVLIGISEEA